MAERVGFEPRSPPRARCGGRGTLKKNHGTSRTPTMNAMNLFLARMASPICFLNPSSLIWNRDGSRASPELTAHLTEWPWHGYMLWPAEPGRKRKTNHQRFWYNLGPSSRQPRGDPDSEPSLR